MQKILEYKRRRSWSKADNPWAKADDLSSKRTIFEPNQTIQDESGRPYLKL